MVNNLYATIAMADKSLRILKDDLQTQLTKYLLKSLCTEAVNALVCYVSSEENPNVTNPEARLKVIQRLEPNLRDPFIKLNASFNSSNLEDFFSELEAATSACDVMVKSLDKKREKTLMAENRQNLLLQLNQTPTTPDQAALTLHLALLLLFQRIHNKLIHASGKFVPLILDFLKPSLESSDHQLLQECQDLVVQQLKAGKGEEGADGEGTSIGDIEKRLEEIMPQVKAFAVTGPKKQETPPTEES
jgi:hypothetical protein